MLRPYVFVGFTGNRNLANPALIAGKILDALTRIATHTGGPLAAVSSAAKGADTLFVEAALSRTPPLPWVLLLPFPVPEFFNEQDFSPEDLARIQPLVARAARVHVERADEDVLSPVVRREHAFADCSARTVDESDYLIVAWDGQPGKAGGTGGTIAYAREQKKPLIWIHAVTGVVTEENFPAGKAAPLPAPSPEIDPRLGGRPALEATLRHYDEQAILHAPKARNLIAWVIWLHLGATAVALLGPILLAKPYLWMGLTGLCLVGLKIFVLLFADRLAHQQHHAKHDWLRARIVAELCRSALATWPLPYTQKTHEPFGVAHFRLWQRSLGLWRQVAPPLPAGEDPAQILASERDAYVQHRFDDPATGQIPYFEKQLRRAEAKQLRASRLARTLTWSAIFCGVLVMLIAIPALLSGHPHESTYPEKAIKWLSVVLPLASSAVFTHLIASDHNRRSERNREMLAHLRIARERIKRATTRSGLERRVAETETLLLLEVLEWHSITHFTGNAH